MSKDTDKPIDDFTTEEATGHSDYKPTDTHDANAKHQLSGMYENNDSIILCPASTDELRAMDIKSLDSSSSYY